MNSVPEKTMFIVEVEHGQPLDKDKLNMLQKIV